MPYGYTYTERMNIFIWVFIFVAVYWSEFMMSTAAEVQKFRVRPKDQRTSIGSPVILNCAISNLVGVVQWSRKGFLLGDDRSLPGYPRFSMTGKDSAGEYNLMIKQVQLEDDGEYECQVTPDPNHAGSQLVAKATLYVLVSPEPPFIKEYKGQRVIKVLYDRSEVKLTCVALNGRPAAVLNWIKDGRNITTNVKSNQKPMLGNNKLFESSNELTIRPRFHAKENNAEYTCTSTHETTSNVDSVIVRLSVQYPPGRPIITGYTSNQPINAGDSIRITCTSKGGNPVASVVWLRNGKKVDYSFSQDNEVAVNYIDVRVRREDNGVIYKCEASNTVTKEPLSSQVKLNVLFDPDHVNITGKNMTKIDKDVILTCRAGASNPAANISWFSQGSVLSAMSSSVKPSAKGGFITISKLKVRLTRREERRFQCSATNFALGKTVSDNFILQAQYAPGQPVIRRHHAGAPLKQSQILRLSCSSRGGNPKPRVSFYKGSKKLPGATKMIAEDVIEEIALPVFAKDNGMVVTCKVKNLAISTPFKATYNISVLFPPDYVNISMSSETVKAGESITLKCVAASSNPAAKLQWIKDSIPLGLVGSLSSREGANKGVVSISELSLSTTADDNGKVYGCQAINEELGETVHDAVTLDVLYPPQFRVKSPTKVTIKEFSDKDIDIGLHSNPSINSLQISEGSRNISHSRIKIVNGNLKLKGIQKSDAGRYTIYATNEQGSSTHTFTIDVQYAATILSAPSPIFSDIKTRVDLRCVADANPMTEDVIKWSRDEFDMTKTKVMTDQSGESVMTIYDLQKQDFGAFRCTASNGIGTPVHKTVEPVVNFAPIIDKLPEKAKAAGDKGKQAWLTCEASGAPKVSFKWFKNGMPIDKSKKKKYRVTKSNSETIKYKSKLLVKEVAITDYGNYTCNATNSKGFDLFHITLDGTSKPDAPYNLRFLNASHNSITISWQPGFDGGLTQRYRVRYREASERLYVYVDVKAGQNTFTTSGLTLDTDYELSVKAINSLGESRYQKNAVYAKTTSVAPPIASSKTGEDDVPLIIILVVCIVGIFLLALNVALILFFIQRRKKRLENGSDSTSQTNTVDLYGPNKETGLYPFTEMDAHSYTSYNKNVDDYNEEANPPYDDEDVKRVFLPPPDYAHLAHPRDERPYTQSEVTVYQDAADLCRSWPYEGSYRALSPATRGTFQQYSELYTDDPRNIEIETQLKEPERIPTDLYGTVNVPVPPIRSVSHEPYPPLPARNYSPQNTSPRYISPPGAQTTVVSQSGRTLTPTSDNPELHGRLV